jgi:RNA polymerase sigma-70 factor (ECF subfamily)
VEAVEIDPARLRAGGAGIVQVEDGRAEFGAVYAAEYRPLLRLAFALTGQWSTAEDLTQEAFLRLHQRWVTVAAYERPGAWLRRVLINLATSRARRLAVEARGLARLGRQRRDEPAVDPDHARFWAAVRQLPKRQAQAVALFYLEDRPTAEVADILGCAEGTVRALLHQGRQTLRQQMAGDDTSEG